MCYWEFTSHFIVDQAEMNTWVDLNVCIAHINRCEETSFLQLIAFINGAMGLARVLDRLF